MIFGLSFCAVFAAIAMLLASVQSVVGAPLIGMFFGIIILNLFPKLLPKVKDGAAFSSKTVLRLGIILCGGTLSFATILGAGGSALPFILLSIAMAFVTACLLGKYVFHVSVNTRVLVAGGTSICGGTAIATLAGVIDADEEEVAYAMTAIFLFDVLAALMWPYVAMGLGMSPEQFSILAGIAINDVSSVTAAGATYDALMGSAAYSASGVTGGDLAVIVKLTRVVMLVFVALAVMVWNMRRQSKVAGAAETGSKGSVASQVLHAFPLFILGFLAMALLNTVIDFSTIQIGTLTLSSLFKTANKFLITVALVGVGSKVDLRSLLSKGIRPVLLGGCTWAVVAVICLTYTLVFM